MTDYCENIVKVFVPDHLVHLVPQLIAGLAAPGACDGEQATWMDFERLLPRPALYGGEDVSDAVDAAVAAHAGRRHHTVDWGDNPPEAREAILDALREVSPEHSSAVDLVAERIRRYGAPSAYEWQMTRWGCKWNAMEGDPPQVHSFDELPGAHGLCDYDGSTMIDWRFTTAYSHPAGYLDALARLCVSAGLGMRAWYSDNEGTAFNPDTNDVERTWTEVEDVAVPIEETSAVRRLELGGGIEIMPDEIAERRIERRNPVFAIFD